MFSALLACATVPIIGTLVKNGVQDSVTVSSVLDDSFDSWKTNYPSNDEDNLQINYNLHPFTVTNVANVLSGDEKPAIEEVKTVSYAEFYNKHNISFSADRTKVNYYQQWFYTPKDEAVEQEPKITTSKQPKDDAVEQEQKITTSNFVVMGLRALVKNSEDEIQQGIIDFIQQSNVIPQREKENILNKINETKISDLAVKAGICVNGGKEKLLNYGPFNEISVRDLYWGTTTDPTLVALKSLLAKFNETIAEQFSTYAAGIAFNTTSEKDSLFFNNQISTYTGYDNIKNLGQIEYWNNMTSQFVCVDTSKTSSRIKDDVPTCAQFQLDWTTEEARENGWEKMFSGNGANVIEGTDGSQTGWEGKILDDEMLPVYIDDLYRSVQLRYSGDVEDWYIPLRRYGIDNTDLAPNSDYDQNAFTGLENITKAAGFPLFASKAHFLDADPQLANGVIGLNPDREIHEVYLDFEPNTGVAMRAAKRLQVNTFHTDWQLPTFVCGTVVEKLFDLADLCECLAVPVDWSKMSEVYLPVVYTDENYEYSKDEADTVNDEIIMPKRISVYVAIGAAGICFLSLSCLLLQKWNKRWAAEKTHYNTLNNTLLGD